MKRLIPFLFFLCVVSGSSRCFAADWKILHERAGKIDLRTALDNVGKAPDSLDDLYVLGLVYLNLYEIGKAGLTFDELVARAPGMKEGLWGKAEVLRLSHKFADSEAILTKIVTDDSRFYPAYLTLSYIRFIQLRFRESVQLSSVIVRRKKQYVDLNTYVRAHVIYAGAKGMLAFRGWPVSRMVNGYVVLSSLREAQAMKPDSPEVLYSFGSYYLLAPRGLGKNLRLAQVYLERAVAGETQFPEGLARLAQLYKIKGELVKYERSLNKALALDPQNELALDLKNRTCRYICPEGGND